MTLTERERMAVENGAARQCIMCRRIVEAWHEPLGILPTLRDWRDEVVTFDVQAQRFHIACEVRTENARGMENAQHAKQPEKAVSSGSERVTQDDTRK